MCYIKENSMEKDAFISVRVNKETKEKAAALLDNFGYSLSSYINVILEEMVKEGYPQLHLIKALRSAEPLNNTLTLLEIKDYVAAASVSEPHILKVFLFGSYARGQATGESDVDLHLVSDGTMSLTDLIAFEKRLSDGLGKKVDVVGSAHNAAPNEFQKMIQPEEIPLYEKRSFRPKGR
jgi:predicted nucleotidyltransferase